MFDLVLKNARIVTPERILENAAIAIQENKIVELVENSEIGLGHRVIDLNGQIVMPGFIDPHCHLGSGDERSFEFMAESFAMDTKDSLLGGITSIATTTVLKPEPLDKNYAQTVEAGVGRSHVNFKVTCVITRDHHAGQIEAAAKLGCSSFKFYTGYCGCLAEKMGMNPEGVPPSLFYQACESAVKFKQKPLMMIHAEEPTVRFMLADRMRENHQDTLLDWAAHSPEWAESVQVYQYGVIAKQFDLPLYIVHISRAHTIDFIEQLQKQGYPIIGETLVAFLTTTAQELHAREIGIYGKIQPPIRYASDQDRLWQSINDGAVTSIGTDSIPYTSKYKDGQAFWSARPGLNIQMPDTIPLLFTEGVYKNKIDLCQLAKVTSEGPARNFGFFPNKGRIAVGADADLVVIDPNLEGQLSKNRYKGHNNYSLWENKKVKGMPTMTILAGEIVVENQEILLPAKGQHLAANYL